MSTDQLQVFLVLLAAIGAMLAARALGRGIDRQSRPEVPPIPPAAPLPPMATGPTTTRRPFGPAPLPTPMMPVAVQAERRLRRVTPADARRGIVLATILGPCRAHSLEEDERY